MNDRPGAELRSQQPPDDPAAVIARAL